MPLLRVLSVSTGKLSVKANSVEEDHASHHSGVTR